MGDRRIRHFPGFSGGPYKMFAVLGVYLLLVIKIIPYLMRNREPYCLRKTIQCYNMCLVFINAFYFFHEFITLDYGLQLLDLSIPSDEEVSPALTHQSNLYYFYVLTKFIDLSDTIFYVLRKKNNQVTFLHLYHHTSITCLAWIGFWFRFNNKPNRIFILLNSLVHTVMYFYYALSAFGPKIQKFLWWKRYITQLQLAQFVIFISYGVVNEVMGIPYPKFLKVLTQIQSPFFLYLFFDFYKSCYKKCNTKSNNVKDRNKNFIVAENNNSVLKKAF